MLKKAVNDTNDWHNTVKIGTAFGDRQLEVLQILKPFQIMGDGHLGLISNASHEITLVADPKPFRSVPYRAGFRMRDIERAEAEKIVEQIVSIPAKLTDCASHVVFALQRMVPVVCVDYTRLNAMTVRNAYRIPHLDECIDPVEDARIFSTLDTNTGYL